MDEEEKFRAITLLVCAGLLIGISILCAMLP